MNAPHASARDREDWPNKSASRFVDAAGVRWHVQTAGDGPTLLLLHGAGASTDSWRDLLPILSQSFHVVAPDLPGQGRSEAGPSSVFPMRGMARAMSALVRRIGANPDIVVGHSAGAALAVRMSLDRLISPKLLIGLNAALQPFGASMAPFFTGVAKFLALNPVAPRLFAWRASRPGAVERLITETGSHIDRRGVNLFRYLATNPYLVAATLRMMANWDVQELQSELPKLKAPLHMLMGECDRTITISQASAIGRSAPHVQIEQIAAVGHLAHEEKPELIAARIIALARQYDSSPEHQK
jgi:magnesium chelatase accessory protein